MDYFVWYLHEDIIYSAIMYEYFHICNDFPAKMHTIYFHHEF